MPLEPPQAPDRRRAILFTALAILLTFAWARFPSPFSGNLWVFFVCCATVLLAASRFRARHSPFVELGLLSFPIFDFFFFQRIHPTARFASVDQLLWVFDRSFGYPQIPLSKLFLAVPTLFALCKLVWLSLPVMFAAAFLALPVAARGRYLAAIVISAVLILPFYAACPGAGPVYLFRESYPGAIPPLPHPHPTFLHPGIELNTTPSGHLAWALLLFWFCFRHCRKPVAAVFAAVAFLIVIATLGLGEHYAIDLVVAFPFAAAVWSLTGWQWRRAAALLVLVAAWCIVLRQGWLLAAPAPLVWTLSLATIAAPAAGRFRLRLSAPGVPPTAWRPAASTGPAPERAASGAPAPLR